MFHLFTLGKKLINNKKCSFLPKYLDNFMQINQLEGNTS